MDTRSIVGLAVGFLVLAGFSVAIVNGGQTKQVLDAAGSGFANLIRAATLQNQ